MFLSLSSGKAFRGEISNASGHPCDYAVRHCAVITTPERPAGLLDERTERSSLSIHRKCVHPSCNVMCFFRWHISSSRRAWFMRGLSSLTHMQLSPYRQPETLITPCYNPEPRSAACQTGKAMEKIVHVSSPMSLSPTTPSAIPKYCSRRRSCSFYLKRSQPQFHNFHHLLWCAISTRSLSIIVLKYTLAHTQGKQLRRCRRTSAPT